MYAFDSEKWDQPGLRLSCACSYVCGCTCAGVYAMCAPTHGGPPQKLIIFHNHFPFYFLRWGHSPTPEDKDSVSLVGQSALRITCLCLRKAVVTGRPPCPLWCKHMTDSNSHPHASTHVDYALSHPHVTCLLLSEGTFYLIN